MVAPLPMLTPTPVLFTMNELVTDSVPALWPMPPPLPLMFVASIVVLQSPIDTA